MIGQIEFCMHHVHTLSGYSAHSQMKHLQCVQNPGLKEIIKLLLVKC